MIRRSAFRWAWSGIALAFRDEPNFRVHLCAAEIVLYLAYVEQQGPVAWAALLLAIAQTAMWSWTGPRTLALLAVGLAVCAAWIVVEVRSRTPLIDMTMMRVRGVWSANLAAFLLGGGLYACFLLLPQFAQLPRSTGFGYGASVVAAGLYLLPCAIGMGVLGSMAGRVERRFGSRRALVVPAA